MRAIDADELYRIEKLLDTDIVRQDRVALNLLEQVLYDIQHVPTLTPPNEWVSVENALPPEHETVLCIVNGKPNPNITLEDAYQLGSWNKADGWIIDEYLDWEDADVSWWMSLPAPPDKDNNVLAKTPNEPLTLEQLREMDGEPVWFVDIKGRKWYPPGWAIVDRDNCLVRLAKSWNPIFFEKYGEWWLAYRRPKEEQ